MAPRDTTPRGTSLLGGSFIDLRQIGEGGSGKVFAAKNAFTGQHVALKLIPTSKRKGEGPDRFLREARIGIRLKHENIVQTRNAFMDGDHAVVEMELLVGVSLAEYLKKTGKLSVREAAEILVPVAMGVREAHRLHVVHRDLKPSNVFLATGDANKVVPKVLDFGIAKVLASSELGSGVDGPTTSTAAFLGTFQYMALEQLMSQKDVDCRADIWALGVILFEALAGRRPIESETPGQMIAGLLAAQGLVLSPPNELPDLPSDVASLLHRCLVVEREGRLDRLEPFIETLDGYRAGGPGGVTVDRRPRGAPRLRMAVMAGATAIALMGGLGMALAIGHRHVAAPNGNRLGVAVEPQAPPLAAKPEGTASSPQPAEKGPAVATGTVAGGTAAPSGPSARHEEATRRARPAEPIPAAVASATRSRSSASSVTPTKMVGILDTPPY